ncbi:MAG: Murein DD-endopeptidase MepM [Gammaproteobacteria bacterium]|nr:Murein DD-endopeptidase MepM [Gammaproteobacteria bacterium]
MQVILLPKGSGPSRVYRFRIVLVCSIVAGVLLAIGVGGGYFGYRIGSDLAHLEQRVPEIQVESFAAVGVEKLFDLKASVDEQRRMLQESRRRVGDRFDSLGRRLGRLQAHVSRIDALGLRLTDMAGLDPDEFGFDKTPALGGPGRPAPWKSFREPELTQSLEIMEIALEAKEGELRILEAMMMNRELQKKQYPRGWPILDGGWISSGYGGRTDPFTGGKEFHEGVDIAARSGSELRAMAAGVVGFAGEKPGYGLVIEINHGNGYETRYAHAKKLIASRGERVKKGDIVALVGSTGRSTGSHVHIEVLKNGKAVNPGGHLHPS